MLIKKAGSSSIMFSYLIQPMAMFSTKGSISDVTSLVLGILYILVELYLSQFEYSTDASSMHVY